MPPGPRRVADASQYFDPSEGTRFVFEALHSKEGAWREGAWLVKLAGSNLGRVYHHLCLSKQSFIRMGANADVPAQNAPEVTGISVTEPPKKG